jgi:hypothetical protein
MAWYNPHVENIQSGFIANLEEGSDEWIEYWQEEIERCLIGYISPLNPSVYIEGRYYFVLNFTKAQTDMGWVHPEFRDYQNEYFGFFEDNDDEGVNTGMKKARRKGFSFLSLMGIIYYDMIFYDAIIDGIAVGDDETLSSMRSMLWSHIEHTDSFFFLQTLVMNKSTMTFGWEEKDEKGRTRKFGTGNVLRMELFSKNVELFKGLIMKHVLFEEVGKFEKLRATYGGTKDCFKFGAKTIGTGIFGGTGGDVEKGSKDFMYMSMNPESFNMRWMFVPSTKGLPPYIDKNGKSIEDPIEKAAAREVAEMYGVSVEEVMIGAKEWWKREEAKLKKAPDKSELYLFYQNNPTKEEHIFLTKGSGVFNQVLIDNQINKLNDLPLYEGAIKGNFKLVHNWKEVYAQNGYEWCSECVEFVEDEEGSCVMWKRPNRLGTDIFGLDPYGQEDTITSDSEGVLYGFRLKTAKTPSDNKMIFKLSGRPINIKDLHYQIFFSLMAYDAQVDAEANMAAEFFSFMEQHKAEKYLKAAPKEYDEFETKAKNKYGRRMSPPVKKIMVGHTAEYINEQIDDVQDPVLLNDWKFFGSKNTDHAYAFGMCLMSAAEYYAIDGVHMQEQEEQQATGTSLIKYKKVNGQIVAIVG